MRPLVFTWPYALVAWGAYFWAFAPEMRLLRRAVQRQREPGAPRDPSLRRMVLIQNAGMTGALAAAVLLPRFAIGGDRKLLFWCGVGLLVGGSMMRRHCWRMLDRYFTGNVEVRPDQPVVDRGAYRWVRHPSYSAGMLMVGGVTLALGNWVGLALGVGLTALAYAIRVRVEEAMMCATLGEAYRSYMRRTKRFVPWVV